MRSPKVAKTASRTLSPFRSPSATPKLRFSSTLTSLQAETDSAHRAELCTGCGAYLKWLDLPEPTPFELLPVEDLASTPLDVLAAQKGFGRPSLPELGGPKRYPCQMEAPAR